MLPEPVTVAINTEKTRPLSLTLPMRAAAAQQRLHAQNAPLGAGGGSALASAAFPPLSPPASAPASDSCCWRRCDAATAVTSWRSSSVPISVGAGRPAGRGGSAGCDVNDGVGAGGPSSSRLGAASADAVAVAQAVSLSSMPLLLLLRRAVSAPPTASQPLSSAAAATPRRCRPAGGEAAACAASVAVGIRDQRVCCMG